MNSRRGTIFVGESVGFFEALNEVRKLRFVDELEVKSVLVFIPVDGMKVSWGDFQVLQDKLQYFEVGWGLASRGTHKFNRVLANTSFHFALLLKSTLSTIVWQHNRSRCDYCH